jgi:hypothetical protein
MKAKTSGKCSEFISQWQIIAKEFLLQSVTMFITYFMIQILCLAAMNSTLIINRNSVQLVGFIVRGLYEVQQYTWGV